ncbi:MAG TPA: LysR substrate-binding domain-containing protein [Solirubrobacteraceae bacterium]|nr:LysR substrate-binding domain-containing protein [Solirubrobacteraceae bacterium]
MDERRLRCFLAVVDEGTVTRAAARLHVAQPSLSQTLRALERELGVVLFHRLGRGLRLSSAGHALTGPAREVLVAIEAARAAVSEVSELLRGTLHLAALATLAVDPLAGLIGRYRRAHPGIVVRVHEPESTAGVSALVRDGTCELGLTPLPVRDQNLRTVALGEQELLFVLPPGALADEDRSHQHRTVEPLAPAALRAIPLVVSPPGTSTRTLLEQALEAVGVTPRIAVETAAREAIVPLVLAGAGAALLPAPLAREAGRRGAVARAAHPRIVRRIGVVYRDNALSPAARALIELARGANGHCK